MVEVGATLPGILGLDEVGAGIEVIGTLHEHLSYLIVIAAAAHMGVEGGWGGMVYTHAGGNTHGSSGLTRPVGETGHGGGLVFQYTEASVLGLVAAGESRPSGS